MTRTLPRVLLAAPKSGAGKTTVVCGLLQALVGRGLAPAACKCGPDYIDPLFHSEIIGAKGCNLDLFFTGADTARCLLLESASGCGVAVLEGVMVSIREILSFGLSVLQMLSNSIKAVPSALFVTVFIPLIGISIFMPS